VDAWETDDVTLSHQILYWNLVKGQKLCYHEQWPNHNDHLHSLGHNVPISKAEYIAYKGMVDLQVAYSLCPCICKINVRQKMECFARYTAL